jgi:hypothetical protein
MIAGEDRPKPPEFAFLRSASAEAFLALKEEFDIPDTYELALGDVDAAEGALRKSVDIAAIAMRKIQAVRSVTKPGAEITNDVVVGLAADLFRALSYLADRCTDQTRADKLTDFKHKLAIAARRAGGDGGIAALR